MTWPPLGIWHLLLIPTIILTIAAEERTGIWLPVSYSVICKIRGFLTAVKWWRCTIHIGKSYNAIITVRVDIHGFDYYCEFNHVLLLLFGLSHKSLVQSWFIDCTYSSWFLIYSFQTLYKIIFVFDEMVLLSEACWVGVYCIGVLLVYCFARAQPSYVLLWYCSRVAPPVLLGTRV
jgi:hypothetical protein